MYPIFMTLFLNFIILDCDFKLKKITFFTPIVSNYGEIYFKLLCQYLF